MEELRQVVQASELTATQRFRCWQWGNAIPLERNVDPLEYAAKVIALPFKGDVATIRLSSEEVRAFFGIGLDSVLLCTYDDGTNRYRHTIQEIMADESDEWRAFRVKDGLTYLMQDKGNRDVRCGASPHAIELFETGLEYSYRRRNLRDVFQEQEAAK